VRTRIYAALKRAQIPLAMPASTVWVEQDDAEHRDRKRKRDLDRRRSALAAVELLRPLRDDVLETIAERLRYAPFAPGEIVTRQGDVAHWLYILTEGTVEVRVHREGAEKAVAKIQAPGFFGEMGLMIGEQRVATVAALTEVECYRLDKEDFNRIIKERPEIAHDISGLLARRKEDRAPGGGGGHGRRGEGALPRRGEGSDAPEDPAILQPLRRRARAPPERGRGRDRRLNDGSATVPPRRRLRASGCAASC